MQTTKPDVNREKVFKFLESTFTHSPVLLHKNSQCTSMTDTTNGDDAEVQRLKNLVKDLEQQNSALRSQKTPKTSSEWEIIFVVFFFNQSN